MSVYKDSIVVPGLIGSRSEFAFLFLFIPWKQLLSVLLASEEEIKTRSKAIESHWSPDKYQDKSSGETHFISNLCWCHPQRVCISLCQIKNSMVNQFCTEIALPIYLASRCSSYILLVFSILILHQHHPALLNENAGKSASCYLTMLMESWCTFLMKVHILLSEKEFLYMPCLSTVYNNYVHCTLTKVMIIKKMRLDSVLCQ